MNSKETKQFLLMGIIWLASIIILMFSFKSGAQEPSPTKMTHPCFRLSIPEETSLYQNGRKICSTQVCEICLPQLGTYRFQSKVPNGLFSEVFPLQRLFGWDSDSNGKVDFGDFSQFSFRYGECLAPNGVVIPCPGG